MSTFRPISKDLVNLMPHSSPSTHAYSNSGGDCDRGGFARPVEGPPRVQQQATPPRLQLYVQSSLLIFLSLYCIMFLRIKFTQLSLSDFFFSLPSRLLHVYNLSIPAITTTITIPILIHISPYPPKKQCTATTLSASKSWMAPSLPPTSSPSPSKHCARKPKKTQPRPRKPRRY